MSIDLESITFWAKNTVTGIILLGAVGSLFALLLLKVFKLLTKKYEESVAHILRPLVRRSIVGQIIGLKVRTEHRDNLQIYYLSELFGVILSTVVLAILIVSTIVYFIVWGVHASVIGVIFLSLSFALGYVWLGDMFEYFGLCDFFINPKIGEFVKVIKKETDVHRLHEILEENCKKYIASRKNQTE